MLRRKEIALGQRWKNNRNGTVMTVEYINNCGNVMLTDRQPGKKDGASIFVTPTTLRQKWTKEVEA